MRPRDDSRARHRRSAPPHRARQRRLSRALLVTLVAGAVVVASHGPLTRDDGRAVAELVEPRTGFTDRRAAKTPASRATEVLRRWDERRASAYARGDLRALRRLYVGRAATHDVRLLASYLSRGYRVQGMRMQLLAVEVLDQAPGEWTLRVTDRLAEGTAVGHGRSVPLPEDRADVRVVRLVRADGVWRAARVTG